MPCVIVGTPCEALDQLQQADHCVMAELSHLQGLSEEEMAEELSKEEAVLQYTNVCIDAQELPQAYLRRIWHRHKKEQVLIAETERLIVRESSVEDAEAFWELYADEQCKRYLEAPPVALNGAREHDLEEYRRYIVQYQQGQYAFYEYGMWSVVEKAVTFIGEMQKVVEQMPASEIAESARTGLNWTGDIVNLVELMYGLQEMQCLNDGKLPIEELGNRIFPLFGLQPRIYSRIYIDIKQRATKNGNRAYFLSRMRNMLEERIDQDIHISLRRK